MLKRFLLSLFGVLALMIVAATPAVAQSGCPAIINGAVLTAGQWNA